MIHAASLAQTVDAVNEADFFQRTIPAAERQAMAEFVTQRHDGQVHWLWPYRGGTYCAR